MHRFTFLLCGLLLAAQLFAQTPQGFSTLTSLTPMDIPRSTKDIQQAKVWNHAGKWWTVLPTFAGTQLLRLDGTAWTPTLTILPSSTNAKTDCRVIGNLAHVLLFRGDNLDSYILSLEYDAASGNYQYWSGRPSLASLRFGAGTETAALELDETGRMWIASDDSTNINVRWSDPPYATWSAPIQLASGVHRLDISAISALPGKVGVIWSNQNTDRFGFRTHANGTDPTVWTADEIPASQSARDIKDGMADEHLSMVVSSNGTLYCAIKTGWNTDGLANIGLLVRHPNGTWDDLYTVDAITGNRPIVLLNETVGKVKVVYTSEDSGGDIVYRESSTASIAFGPTLSLIANGHLLSYAASTHQRYDSTVVVLATDESTAPLQLVGVLAKEGASTPDTTTPPPPTGAKVESFTLVNSATEGDVVTITDGAVLNLAALGVKKANIRANTSPSSVGSVKFELSGTQTRTYTDSEAPYALHGDDGSGNYYYGNWNPPALGTYTLKATPYSGAKGTGEAGIPLTITFTITDGTLTTGLVSTHRPDGSAQTTYLSVGLQAEAMAYPNPFTARSTINFTLPQAGQYTITLHDRTGKLVKVLKQGWAAEAIRHSAIVDGDGLPGGLYFVRIQAAASVQTLKLLYSK